MATGSRLASRLIGTRIITGGETDNEFLDTFLPHTQTSNTLGGIVLTPSLVSAWRRLAPTRKLTCSNIGNWNRTVRNESRQLFKWENNLDAAIYFCETKLNMFILVRLTTVHQFIWKIKQIRFIKKILSLCWCPSRIHSWAQSVRYCFSWVLSQVASFSCSGYDTHTLSHTHKHTDRKSVV